MTNVYQRLLMTTHYSIPPARLTPLTAIIDFWPCRHPASGYVQGINDLVTPFLAALLSQHFDGPMESWDIETLSEESMYAVEADAYWMLCKLLDGIQDHYTNAQPGIQRTVFKLKELVRWVKSSLLILVSVRL